jgi:hypothetical protein
VNAKTVLSAAHFYTRCKKANGDRRPYREILAEMMRLGWARAREAVSRVMQPAAPRRSYYMSSPRYISAVGA